MSNTDSGLGTLTLSENTVQLRDSAMEKPREKKGGSLSLVKKLGGKRRGAGVE